jgi:hypothetical protein
MMLQLHFYPLIIIQQQLHVSFFFSDGTTKSNFPSRKFPPSMLLPDHKGLPLLYLADGYTQARRLL